MQCDSVNSQHVVVAAALKEHNLTPEVPDWVMDNSIKFEGKARKAAASFGVTGAPGGDQHKQTSALGHGQVRGMPCDSHPS